MRSSFSPSRILLPLFATLTLASGGLARATEPAVYSGIYPHLAMYALDPAEPRPANLHPSFDGECGTGAVVPWADRLWVITYAPHADRGSKHKLYEITPDLRQIIRPESVGGTPANRMIHRESGQLFIGPYAIDAQGGVRVIPPATMPGRLTGTARHLSDPAGKVYTATMEQGFYEIDVNTLAVKILYPDSGDKKNGGKYFLPGYHGKGLYSGQGVLVFSNNGERGTNRDLKAPSGVLASWDGQDWTVVRRNQFVEVTGPGGIFGNARPATDPIWATGWDTRSVLLQVLDNGKWTSYRLPKSSHSYDGVQGWNTEWPRIREIGEGDLLMTMHGAFHRFPAGFRPGATAGIRPRSNYLKVVGDFARWGDRIVLGTDDTARAEFYNKGGRKGDLLPPGVSQSNLWFVSPGDLDRVGPVLGRGSVWLGDAVAAETPSDPYLFAGYESRCLHLRHKEGRAVRFTLEVDLKGDGRWSKLRDIEAPASGYVRVDFDPK